MASRSIPAPSCPEGHLNAAIHSWGTRRTAAGVVRRWKCQPVDGAAHAFSVLIEDGRSARDVIDSVVPVPECPLGHDGSRVTRKGSYKTTAGNRQRYLCVPEDGLAHKFTAPLPRALVTADVHCADCGLPTPSNAGSEATARRSVHPVRVVFRALQSLADGRSYAETSLQALESMGRPVARSRSGYFSVREDGPERDAKAHWHVAADVLETFGPFVTGPALDGIAAEEARYRASGLPVIYTADDVPVKRRRIRSSRKSRSAMVWAALVVTRVKWAPGPGGRVDRSNRLARVRAMPSVSQAAWEVVFSELEPPDYLVCDGATPISNAARAVWGEQVVLVPCIWHAARTLEEAVTLPKSVLPEKVRDVLNALSRENLATWGPAGVPAWFDDLEAALHASGLPVDRLWNMRPAYESLLARSAEIASSHQNPWVPISNAGAETLIQNFVTTLTVRRGPMFTNLSRTNLLGDLLVAKSNGYLNDEHAFAVAVRASNREFGGWAPPPRALNEPLGAMNLRNPRIIPTLLPGAAS